MKSDVKMLAETMKLGFEQVDKRFEQVDKRFEDMNKRVTFITWFIGIGFVFVNLMIILVKFLS